MENYIITIARGLGSGGSHVGKKLSETLGIPCYDTEILEMASELSGINETYFFEANEKINKGQIRIRNSKGVYTGHLYAVSDAKYLSDENLFNYQAEVIKSLALGGKQSCIIIGKAANKIIGSLKNVVTVNIQAPMDVCIGNIVNRLQINTVEAKEKILQTNKYRANYYRYYTGSVWNDSTEYDLTINPGAVGEDYAAQMIVEYLKHKGLMK